MNMMRDDQAFNIEFVKTVEQYPVLYNSTMSDYTSKTATEQAWNKIASIYKESASTCREKWKTLRGCYTRSLKNRFSGERLKRPYYLSSYLEFLNPYLKPRTQVLVMPEVNEYGSEDEIEQKYVVDEEKLMTINEDSNHTDFGERSPSNSQGKRKCDSSQENYHSSKKRKLDDYENADLLFWRSLLPDIALLDRNKKSVFKVKVMNLLNDIINE